MSAPKEDAAIFIKRFFTLPRPKTEEKIAIPLTDRNESCKLTLPTAAGLNRQLPINGMAIEVIKSASRPKKRAKQKYVNIAEALMTEGFIPEIKAKSQTKHREKIRHHVFLEKKLKKP